MDVIGPLKQEVNRQTGEERDPDELAQDHDEPDRLLRELFGRQHRSLSEHMTNIQHQTPEILPDTHQQCYDHFLYVSLCVSVSVCVCVSVCECVCVCV